MTAPDATPGREFTPSMERLRDEYVQMRAEHYGFSDLYADEFDRALVHVRAEAWDEGFVARLGDTPRYKSRAEWGNPYRDHLADVLTAGGEQA